MCTKMQLVSETGKNTLAAKKKLSLIISFCIYKTFGFVKVFGNRMCENYVWFELIVHFIVGWKAGWWQAGGTSTVFTVILYVF